MAVILTYIGTGMYILGALLYFFWLRKKSDNRRYAAYLVVTGILITVIFYQKPVYNSLIQEEVFASARDQTVSEMLVSDEAINDITINEEEGQLAIIIDVDSDTTIEEANYIAEKVLRTFATEVSLHTDLQGPSDSSLGELYDNFTFTTFVSSGEEEIILTLTKFKSQDKIVVNEYK